MELLWPDRATELDDDEIAARYGMPEGLRVNFVTSLDGSATREGRSGGLGTPGDRRVFDLLRRLCDVVIVGAGTVRIEGYGPMTVSDRSARWRTAHGLAPQPVFAIVSASGELDPGARIFTEAPVRPIVATHGGFDGDADVVIGGPRELVAELRARGLRRMLCEGGPELLGSLVDADLVDELCLTTSPLIVGGDGPRIVTGASAVRRMRLAHLLSEDDALFARYVREP